MPLLITSPSHFEKRNLNFDSVRSELPADHNSLLTSVNSCLEKLHAGLAIDNKIKDDLAQKTAQLDVQSAHLAHAQKEIASLKTKQTVLKSCAGDIISILRNLVNAHDPVLTLTIRNHLTAKLLPAIQMLSQIQGVTEPVVDPQQGEEA